MTAAHPGCNGYGHAPGCPHLTGEAVGVDLLAAEPDTAYEDAVAALRARLDAPGTNETGTAEPSIVSDLGDDPTRLYHGTYATHDQIAATGLLPQPGLSNDGMLGTHPDGTPVTAAIFLTPDPDEAASYGPTVLRVDVTGLDVVVVDGPDGYHYAVTEPVPAHRITTPLPETTGADLPALAFCSATGFDPARVKPVVNDSFVKPRGGLWLSPVTGDTTGDGVPGTAWSDYVAHEQYDRAATGRVERLALAPDARVLVIDSYDDFLAARAAYPPPDTRGLAAHGLNGVQGLDFERLAADGYAAIWLTDAGQRATHMAPDDVDLYGWDVESVLVLDADAVRRG